MASNGGYIVTEPLYFRGLTSFDVRHPLTSLDRLLEDPGVCHGHVIRPFVYGSSRRDDAAELVLKWNALGADVQGTVDIAARASFEGRPPPNIARRSTIRYAEGTAEVCIRKLLETAPQESFEPLPVSRDRLPRGAIDVWLTHPDSKHAVKQLTEALKAAHGRAAANPVVRQLTTEVPSASVDPTTPAVTEVDATASAPR
jgi:hypothetical protein